MYIAYRKDIDGLRSIAVGSVVLFHSGFTVLSGGFVGVDIFFVISGYLISARLFKYGQSEGISIARFYERRIRRIMPAYGAVIAASLLAGTVLLLPSELMALARSALASAAFSANLYFWSGASYFAGEPLSKPLLHLWSLAVEEQFYIVWPLAVMALYKLGWQRWLVPLILAGIVTTLAASELMLGYSPKTAFYMAPLRAWELLLGALLAAPRAWPRLPGAWAAHLIGATALALILVPVFTYSELSRFPGLAAVPPCLGAFLLIYRDERHQSFASRLLSTPVPVFLGLISYSLYLWHWPMLSFYWYWTGQAPGPLAAVVLIAAMVAVATLSWRYIEAPFRSVQFGHDAGVPLASRLMATTRSTLAFGGIVLALLAATTAAMIAARGIPQRLPSQAIKVDSFEREPYVASAGCVLPEGAPEHPAQRCFGQADALAGRKIVLWGDSYAGQHIKTVEQAFNGPGQAVVSVVAFGCSPFPGVTQYFGEGRADTRCGTFNDAIYAELLRRKDVREVIIAGRWSNLHGVASPGGGYDPTARFLVDAAHREKSFANSLAVMAASLDRAVAGLEARGVAVTILLEPPSYARDVKPCVSRGLWHGTGTAACGLDVRAERRYREPLDAVFRQLARRHPRLRIFDPLDNLCPRQNCSGYRDGVLVTQDFGHLTRAGSQIALAGLARGS